MIHVLADAWLTALPLGALALLCLFWRHSRSRSHPAVDLGLRRERAFGIATLAGGLCRIPMNGPVYRLPLMLQLGLGMSPVQSGTLTFLLAVALPVVRVFIGAAAARSVTVGRRRTMQGFLPDRFTSWR